MITIVGATGHVGRQVTTLLVAQGLAVRALGRNTDVLQELSLLGADSVEFTISSELASNLRGSDAVFVMAPSNPFAVDFADDQRELGTAIADAVHASGAQRVVALSSLGADRTDAPGVIGALHEQEERLRALTGVSLHLLRPVSFFENLLAAVDQLTETGTHVDSVDADLPIPMIATADIARAAATALTGPAWSGTRSQPLLGQRDLSYDEATATLGAALGVPAARYQQLDYTDMADVLVSVGFSKSYAEMYVDMTRAFNSQELTGPTPRTPDNTTGTSFEQFVGATFADAAVVRS